MQQLAPKKTNLITHHRSGSLKRSMCEKDGPELTKAGIQCLREHLDVNISAEKNLENLEVRAERTVKTSHGVSS